MTTSGIGPTGPGTGPAYNEVVSGAGDRPDAPSTASTVSAGDRTDLTDAVSPRAEALFAAATSVRTADAAMSDAEGLLQQLRDQLQMVKLYPPYPANEPRRAALVRQLLGIQKQLAAQGGAVGGLKLPQISESMTPAAVDQSLAAAGAAAKTIAARRASLAGDSLRAASRTTGSKDDPASAAALAERAGQALAGCAHGLTSSPLSLISGLG